MKIKLVSKSGILPAYETENSAGVDLRAFLEEKIVLKPMERRLIPTGIFVEIPEGYEGQVRARSGLSIKFGITLINGIGTIDSDYRGELCVPLVNFGEKDFIINDGDRIAQLIIKRYEKVQFIKVDSLSDTVRGIGGFGHTGVK